MFFGFGRSLMIEKICICFGFFWVLLSVHGIGSVGAGIGFGYGYGYGMA